MTTVVKTRRARRALTLTSAGEVVEGTPFAVETARSRRIDLNTLQKCRGEMARVYREVRGGRLDSQEASRLVYMLGQIGRMIELTDLEQRLTLLEEHSS